jgi:hypothetical protein
MPILQALKCKLGHHHWQDWHYGAEDSCEQARRCPHCYARETRQAHEWQWQYLSDNNCKQIGTCRRCKTETNREEHDFTEWSVSQSQESGENIAIVPGSDTIVTPWTYVKIARTRGCQRCGHIEEEITTGETIYGDPYGQ